MSLFRNHSTITTDDGTVLEVKEAQVIGQDGSVLSSPAGQQSHRTAGTGPRAFQVHAFRGGWLFGLLLLIVIPLLLFAGLTVIGVMIAGTILVWALRTIVRLFRV